MVTADAECAVMSAAMGPARIREGKTRRLKFQGYMISIFEFKGGENQFWVTLRRVKLAAGLAGVRV